MASSHLPLPGDITSLVLLFIIFISTTHSHNVGNSPADATAAECGPSIMMLAPCAPFVQGTASLPALSCCGSLREFLEEDQDLRCLCLLLNDSTLGTVPINTTLALQLPTLCNLQPNISTCSGLPVPDPPSPGSPSSQVTFGARANSTVPASPAVAPTIPASPAVSPRSNVTGSNSRSTGAKFNAESRIAITLLAAIAFVGRI